MTENNGEDDFEIEDCQNCGPSDHEDMGIIPHTVVKADLDNNIRGLSWVHAFMCTSCGNIQMREVTQEEIDQAIDQIIDLYDEHELASEEEIESLRR